MTETGVSGRLERSRANLYKDFQRQNDIWEDVRYPEVTYRMTCNVFHCLIFVLIFTFLYELLKRIGKIQWQRRVHQLRSHLSNFKAYLEDKVESFR